MQLDSTDIAILSCLSDIPHGVRELCQTAKILGSEIQRRLAALRQLPELGIRREAKIQNRNSRRGYVWNPMPWARLEIEARYLQWEQADFDSVNGVAA